MDSAMASGRFHDFVSASEVILQDLDQLGRHRPTLKT